MGAEKAYGEARNIGLRWWYVAIKKQLMEFKFDVFGRELRELREF